MWCWVHPSPYGFLPSGLKLPEHEADIWLISDLFYYYCYLGCSVECEIIRNNEYERIWEQTWLILRDLGKPGKVCQSMKFEVFMVLKIWIMVFWVTMKCSHVATYQCFRGAYCLHLQDKKLISGPRIKTGASQIWSRCSIHYRVMFGPNPNMALMFCHSCSDHANLKAPAWNVSGYGLKMNLDFTYPDTSNCSCPSFSGTQHRN
jgi:hypothetical protein